MDIQRYKVLAEQLFDNAVALEYLPNVDNANIADSLPSAPPLHGSFTFDLLDCFDMSLGGLLVTVSDCADEIQSFEFVSRVRRFVDWTKGAIVADIEREREMDGMAEDLGDRYEELNLVYALDDLQEQLLDHNAGNVFEQLSDMCVRYLGVDDAFFMIRDFVRVRDDDQSSSYKDENPLYDREVLARYVLNHLQNDARTLVCNKADDSFWDGLSQNQGIRIIGAPVFDMNHQVYGVFVVVNSLDKVEYTNGDRKTAEVLVSHASNALIGFQDELTGLYNQTSF